MLLFAKVMAVSMETIPASWDNLSTAINPGSGTAWAILFSATLAFIAVFVAGWLQRGIQRQILTFNNQSQLLWDEDYQKFRQIFIAIRDGDGENLTHLAQDNEQSSELASAVRTILSDYELVAIGIKKKILDEDFLKVYYKTTLVRDCIAMMPYIKERRRVRDNQAFYIEFQKLARKWADNESQNGLD